MTWNIWIFVLKKKNTVRKIIEGGFIGYSGGRQILPWYNPPSNSVSSGPRITKCHSNKLSSSGNAMNSSGASSVSLNSFASVISLRTAWETKTKK